jgi:hypothetical protein
MDRTVALQHLALAEHHAAEGEHHLARQEQLIAKLDWDGLDTSETLLLATLRETQQRHRADVERLLATLVETT